MDQWGYFARTFPPDNATYKLRFKKFQALTYCSHSHFSLISQNRFVFLGYFLIELGVLLGFFKTIEFLFTINNIFSNNLDGIVIVLCTKIMIVSFL